MNQQEVNTTKPTAVIDMSVLREICEQEPRLRQSAWDCLTNCYQLAFPLVLVEEAVCQWLSADSSPLAEGIAGVVVRRPQLWMEDIHEIIGRELLDRRLPERLTGCCSEVQDGILKLKRGTEEAAAWLGKRRAEAEEIEADRRAFKKRFLPQLGTKARRLNTEGDFFREVVAPFFRDLTLAGKERLPLVDHWLGTLLKRRTSELAEEFDKAFSELLSTRWTQFYLTAGLLQLRFAYLAAPLFTLDCPRLGPSGGVIHIGLNDRTDEEYIASGFLCQRLLTQDLGMARIMAAFEDGGFWKGRTIHLQKGQWLSEPGRFCT